ncbi:unannotated protein [freshwater metagenome]|uniref:Unannotated protein n=1 Tax=freshwater metagenome TaxID=449393 RepID=A0A6J6ELL9_9ZZZZ
MIAQWRLVSPAVGQHSVALIGKALVVELLEGPDDAFHEGDVQSLVVVLKINPARLTRDVFFPLLRIPKNRIFGGLVEGRNPHCLNLTFIRDAELPFCLELRGEAVSVPSKPAMDLLAAHRVKPGEDVLGVTGQEVTIVRQSIGKGWAVIEDPLFATLAVINRPLEGVMGGPVGEHLVLECWKRRAWLDARSVAVARKSHRFLPDNGGGWTLCEDAYVARYHPACSHTTCEPLIIRL